MKKYILLLILPIMALNISCREDIVEDTTTIEEDQITLSQYNTYLRTLEEELTSDIYVNCKARQTKDETLITAIDTVSGAIVIVGIKGFENGEYFGNIIGLGGSGDDGIKNNSVIDIESYGEVGDQIIGRFKDGSLRGDFVADRIQ